MSAYAADPLYATDLDRTDLVSNGLGIERTWRHACGQGGNASEDDADKAGEGQHQRRRDGEKPEHPGRALGSTGGLMVAKRRGHRGLL